MNDYVVVFITAPDFEEAQSLGQKLVERGLAACVNLIPAISSIFFWEGKLCREQEVLMVVKSTAPLFSSLSEYVKEHHPYEVPEIIALPVSEGLKAYLDWVKESCKKTPE